MKTKLKNVKPLTAKNFQNPKKPVTPSPFALPSISEDYDLLELEHDLEPTDAHELENLDPSNELTQQETRLIGIYLDHPDQPKQTIAKLAGYQANSPKALIRIFNLLSKIGSNPVHILCMSYG